MPHIHEKIDFTATVFVVNGDAVLLRKHEKYNAWFGVGGHIELDEDPNQAALREVKEEAGLDVTLVGDIKEYIESGFTALIPPAFLNKHVVGGGPHVHVDLIYIARSTSRECAPAATEQPVEFHWFTRAELDNPSYELRDRVAEYAKAALDAAHD